MLMRSLVYGKKDMLIMNKILSEGSSRLANNIVELASVDASEWKPVSTPSGSTINHRPLTSTICRWRPPQLGFLKCNVDASWSSIKDVCGTDWILRNAEGKIVCFGSKTYLRLCSPLEAEVAALTWATNCVINLGYRSVIFETDSKLLIKSLENIEEWPRLHTLTSEILKKAPSHSITFQHIGRTANKAAGHLAKVSSLNPIYVDSINFVAPLSLSGLLHLDYVIG